jgi:hypothetical protein
MSGGDALFELRIVMFGPNRQLEYRQREAAIDNWGEIRRVGDWSDWKIVPTVDGDEASYEDLRASGGIAKAP